MEGQKLNICIVNNTIDTSPSYIARNKIVAEELNRRGHNVYCEAREPVTAQIDLDAYDIFVFNRFYEGTMLKTIPPLQAMGKIIIYETDDNYEAINETHPLHKIKSYAVLSSREMANMADAITCSTETIKEVLKHEVLRSEKDIYVVPNALIFSDYPIRKGGNKKVRVGFQGSNIHSTDLLMVIDAVSDLQKELDFEFYIFGIDDTKWKVYRKFVEEYQHQHYEWVKDFRKLAEKLDGMKFVHIPFCDYSEYQKKLSELNFDIGICPLTDNIFNRSKSCLKFYEYAAVGTAALASKVTPYKEEMSDEDLAKNRYRHWYSKLKRLITDEEFRKNRTANQYLWVSKNRDLKVVGDQWERVYNSIINKCHAKKNNNRAGIN